MTTLDAIVLISILLLVFGVIRCWNGPIPPVLMRPSTVVRLGVDNFIVTSQSTDGQWLRVEGPALADVQKGDVVFIEQPNGPTQMLYVNHCDHGMKDIAYLVRDPE